MNIYWLKMTDSTNNDALKSKDSEPDMTVWCSEYQSAGRGQRGNRWESRPGDNLTFSILFRPESVSAADQFVLSQVSAVGVADYLQEKGLPAKVKWPNDVYVGDRKICGMLIENTLSGDRLSASVSGIGININQRLFPPELPNPTSLVLELERAGLPCPERIEVKEELLSVLRHIFSLYLQIGADGKVPGLDARYAELLYRKGEFHEYEETGYYDGQNRLGRIRAKILGVDEKTARLRLELEDGQVREYFFKEIRYII